MKLIKDFLYCVAPVFVVALHIHFGIPKICLAIYAVSALVSMWRFMDAAGDVGRWNVLMSLAFHCVFVGYFTVKAFAPGSLGNRPFDPHLGNAPVFTSFLLMTAMIYSGIYVLLLNDGKIRIIPAHLR